MRYAIVATLLAALLAISIMPPASAAEARPQSDAVTVAMALTMPQGLVAPSAKPMTPLLRPAASYCRFECDHCRKHCYKTYRVHCHGYGCRQQFTVCMRGCGNTICRYC